MERKDEKKESKAKILVVEDDIAIAFGLQKNLKFEDYDVTVATDGEAGLERAVNDRPDLIILDYVVGNEIPG